MNGKVFGGLINLSKVFLNYNECIDKNFIEETELILMDKSITENCGFDEPVECEHQSCGFCESLSYGEKQIIDILDNLVNETALEAKKCQLKQEALESEIRSLQAQLHDAKLTIERVQSGNNGIV